MFPGVHLLQSISPSLANLLVASVWESLLLTTVSAIGLRFLPKAPATLRSTVWTAVLGLIVLLPVLTAAMPHRGGLQGASVHVAASWSEELVSLWLVLSLARFVQLCLGFRRLRELARTAVSWPSDGEIESLLWDGSRRISLCASACVDRPSVVGFLQPTILIPSDLTGKLTTEELRQILLHEMEHLRRGDHWRNLLQQISMVLLPWNPAVLWVDRRLCFERELACDEGVVRATRARKAYAACLLRLAEHSMLRRGVSLTLGLLGAVHSRARESELSVRVRRILSGSDNGLQPRSFRAAGFAMLCGSFAVCLLLARSPRLVDFSGGPLQVAASASSPESANAPPSRIGLGRPVLVKAVVAGPVRTTVAVAKPVAERSRLSARRVKRAAVDGAAVRVPMWHSSPRRPGAYVTLTSADDSQNVYAAVPWQGGWLLIQL